MHPQSDKFLEKAKKLDDKDELRDCRNEFVIEDHSLIYLDGNSLGRLPKKTSRLMEDVVLLEWGKNLINSWNKSWYHKSAILGDKIARIIGAQPGEVLVSDSTSVNLFKLAYAALNYQKPRNRIVSDDFNFPSDLYIFQGLAPFFSKRIEIDLIRSEDQITISEKNVRDLINSETALLSLSHVAFKSAFMYDMQRITRLAHNAGAMVLWDLSHSAGVVPLKLHNWNVDMAVGCTYKYLNGGPGAPAFLYVRNNLHEKLHSPIQGWFGASNPFDFSLDFQPAAGIRRFLAGTPPVISLSATELGLDIILEVGIPAIRDKSIRLSDFLIGFWKDRLSPLGFVLKTPLLQEHRGSHVSFAHPEAFRIVKALIDKEILGYSVVPDFREPDIIRLGLAPLYNTFTEIARAVYKLEYIAGEQIYRKYPLTREDVT